MTGVIDEISFAFKRGRKKFGDGKPCPPKIDDEEIMNSSAAEWFGWRIELWREYEKRRAVIDLLGEKAPDDLMKRIIDEHG